MARIGRMSVQIGVDLNKFRSDMNSAFTTLNSSTGKMQRSLSGLNSGFKAVTAVAAGFAAALATSQLTHYANELIHTADAFNQLQGKVRNSLDDVTQFDSVFKQLVASSNRSGVAIDGLAQAFTRLRPAAQELGKSNKDLIRFNETFAKMGALAGATTTEINNSMIQLSQGLSAGTLRGDELRSVMEQMPQVARTIADSMGIPFKDFKKAAEAGKISAEAVFKAIIDKSKEVDEQFSKLPPSVARSTEAMKNSLLELLGQVDKNSEMTKTYASAIQDATNFLIKNKDTIIQVTSAIVKSIVEAIKFTGAIIQLGVAVKNLVENLNPWRKSMDEIRQKFLGGKSDIEIWTDIIQKLANSFKWMAEKINDATAALGRFFNKQKQDPATVAPGRPVDLRHIDPKFRRASNSGDADIRFASNTDDSMGENINTTNDWGGSNVINMADFIANLKTAKQATADLGLQGQATFSQMDEAIRSVGDSITQNLEGAFNEFIETGKIQWKQLFSMILKDIARIIFSETVSKPIGKGISSFISNFIGGLFGGGRASGGPVEAGKSYMVGEEGPEIVTFPRSGHVTPNHELGGGGNVVNLHQYFTIQTIDNRDFEDRLAEHARFIGNVSVQAVQKQSNRMGQRGPMERARG